MMTREDAIKLLRACAVLYHGADDEIRRLAENEFSGCASTMRDQLNELEVFLHQQARNIRLTQHGGLK